jgi:hypothetical protein
MQADIAGFLWDLADHWAALLTGGTAAAVFLVWERLRGKPFSLRTFTALILIGFVVASFQAHKHLSDELKQARSDNIALRADVRSANDQLLEVRRQLADASKWNPLANRARPAIGTAERPYTDARQCPPGSTIIANNEQIGGTSLASVPSNMKDHLCYVGKSEPPPN